MSLTFRRNRGDSDSSEPMSRPLKPMRLGGPVAVSMLVLFAILFLPIWFWFFCRIEPGSDEIAILIRKTGENLPAGEIIAKDASFKGIQLEVLSEGRYFRNPYTWGWTIAPVTDIPAGRLGVQTRLFGTDLPPGRIIAGTEEKGIVEEVLRPGKYRINPHAYSVQQFDAVTVRPGYIGVVISLIGDDVINSEVPAAKRNKYLVEKGMKGVMTEVVDAGTYYLNPYVFSIVEMTLQSQRFEMSGEDAITFLTMDGFTVTVEGTIEFSIKREFVAMLTHKVGDLEDVVKKVILPRARGFSRIEGSKNPATSYIVGETRQLFQDSLEKHLKERCLEWGVDIKSVLIRNITPPEDIASIIREREVAVQTAKTYERQITQARSKAELTKQEMLAQQNKEKVEAETLQIRAVILAQQKSDVLVTNAVRELEVAKLENEAAAFQAQAILLSADATQKVIRLQNEAQAGVLKTQAEAFGGGMNVARFSFYTNIAPRIQSILTTDSREGLGGIFDSLKPGSFSAGAANVMPPPVKPKPPSPPPVRNSAVPVTPSVETTEVKP